MTSLVESAGAGADLQIAEARQAAASEVAAAREEHAGALEQLLRDAQAGEADRVQAAV